MTAVDLSVVVIGSGRSGTAWAARHLTGQGVPCGHESVFDWHPSADPTRRLDYAGRTPSPHEPPAHLPLEAEASLAAIAHLAHLPEGCHVWHVARHPFDVIRSWVSSGILAVPLASPYGRFVIAHVPDVATEASPVARAARWVAEWNLRGRTAARSLGLPYTLTRLEDEGTPPVNEHPIGSRPGMTWARVRAEATPDTVRLLTRWAATAGYPLEDR